MNIIDASKFLSYVLRHEPESIGIALDPEGWVDIDSLMEGAATHGKSIDRAQIQAVVDNSDKRRFAISQDKLRIRAVQGHSTQGASLTFLAVLPPPVLYHGTASRFLTSIRQQGLVSGSRHYVHLSEDLKTAAGVGKRHGEAVVLLVDAIRMHQEGFVFFRAENAVWLTSRVPSAFLMFPS